MSYRHHRPLRHMIPLILAIASALNSCQATIPVPFTSWGQAQYACAGAQGVDPGPWTLTGTLPQGVAFDAATGLLSPSGSIPNAPTGLTIDIAGEPTPAPGPLSEDKGTGETVHASNSAARL